MMVRVDNRAMAEKRKETSKSHNKTWLEFFLLFYFKCSSLQILFLNSAVGIAFKLTEPGQNNTAENNLMNSYI